MPLDKTELEGADPAALDVFSNDEWRTGHHALTWCLYGAGFFVVFFAHALGDALKPKVPLGPNAFLSNPQDAIAIETNARIVGGMMFAAGLVERLVLAIKSAKCDR